MSMTQLQATRLVAQEITNAYTVLEGTEFDKDYSVSFGGFTNAKRQLGVCHSRGRVRTIKLSKYLLNSTDEVILDTIKHELGHAFSPTREGHGAIWKRCCRKLGMKNPQRLAGFEDMPVESKYIVLCELGGKKYQYVCGRHRKPKDGFSDRQLKGRPETLGKLKIVPTAQVLSLIQRDEIIVSKLPKRYVG